ncbi:MAG: FHA domain-containing protein, partial [Planctomycetaceae bacterium]
MSEESARKSAADNGAIAYLVVREGNSWRDVFRLVPGQVTTIGRASTNRIVLHDEVCSRNHCEVFTNTSGWVLRDLESRNGTVVDQQLIKGDHELVSGESIQIGATNLGFTFDLSQPFAELPITQESQSDTATDLHMAYPSEDAPAIVRRKRKSEFGSPPSNADSQKMAKALAALYRLALDMGTVDSSKQVCDVVLKTLFEETEAAIGAILCLPTAMEKPKSEELRIVAYRSKDDQPYERVSDFLSGAVMKDREAILAHDIKDHAELAERESLDEIQATSVICAPLRVG